MKTTAILGLILALVMLSGALMPSLAADDATDEMRLEVVTASNDNRLTDADKYSFTNVFDSFLNYFDSTFKNRYQINDELFDKLCDEMAPSVVEKLESARDEKWAGSCYGMAATAALLKYGSLTPSAYGADTVNEFQMPKKNVDVENMINFYNLMQFLPDTYDHINDESQSELLKLICTGAEDVKNGGFPVLISMAWDTNEINSKINRHTSMAHAVLAYDIEEVDETVDGLQYAYKVSIYDPAQTNSQYLYINKDYSDWVYPMLTNYDLFIKNNKEQKYCNAFPPVPKQ